MPSAEFLRARVPIECPSSVAIISCSRATRENIIIIIIVFAFFPSDPSPGFSKRSGFNARAVLPQCRGVRSSRHPFANLIFPRYVIVRYNIITLTPLWIMKNSVSLSSYFVTF